MDASGRVRASGTHEHQPFASPRDGWAEQEPADWWRACAFAVRQALEQADAVPGDVACIGFSGQMHGAVLLDGAGEVIRPAIIWCDQRTEKQSQELVDRFGLARIIQLTCNPPLTNFTLTKLLWVRENEPHHWSRIRHILLPKDYIRYKLTGDFATDVADASGTLMLDVARRRWSAEILRGSQIPSEWLPELFESSALCGKLSNQGAETVGLQVGTPVVAGAGDQAAGAVGMGIVSAGVVSATIGTSGVVFATTDHPALDPEGRLHTFCHAIPERWHVMGVTQAAGLSLRWFRDQLGAGVDDGRDPYERLAAEAASVTSGSDGLFWAPYLMGERTPHLDPSVRGALIGVSASHTRGHLIRAILEGVAFSLKDSFSIFAELKVPVTKIRLGGGGARSALWRQIQADVYAHEVELLEAEEGAAYGAAILAAVGAAHWGSVEQACEAIVRVTARIAPLAASSAALQNNYAVYRRIYPALRSIGCAKLAAPVV